MRLPKTLVQWFCVSDSGALWAPLADLRVLSIRHGPECLEGVVYGGVPTAAGIEIGAVQLDAQHVLDWRNLSLCCHRLRDPQAPDQLGPEVQCLGQGRYRDPRTGQTAAHRDLVYCYYNSREVAALRQQFAAAPDQAPYSLSRARRILRHPDAVDTATPLGQRYASARDRFFHANGGSGGGGQHLRLPTIWVQAQSPLQLASHRVEALFLAHARGHSACAAERADRGGTITQLQNQPQGLAIEVDPGPESDILDVYHFPAGTKVGVKPGARITTGTPLVRLIPSAPWMSLDEMAAAVGVARLAWTTSEFRQSLVATIAGAPAVDLRVLDQWPAEARCWVANVEQTQVLSVASCALVGEADPVRWDLYHDFRNPPILAADLPIAEPVAAVTAVIPPAALRVAS